MLECLLKLCLLHIVEINYYLFFLGVKIHKVKAKTGALVTLPCETPHDDYEILNWYRNDSLVPIATKQKVYTHVSMV